MTLQQKIIIIAIFIFAIIVFDILFVIYKYKSDWVYKYKKEKEMRKNIEKRRTT